MPTNIYEYDSIDPSLIGWQALLTNNFAKSELFNHTYIRYPVLSGEMITSGEALNLCREAWRQAKADGLRHFVGVAIESGVSGEYVRARTLGPIDMPTFNFPGSGEIVYLGLSGEFQITPTISNVEIIGFSLSRTKLFIRPQFVV